MEKRLVLGCIIFGIILNLQGVSCVITCLHCNGAQHVSDCYGGNSFLPCKTNEICYMEKRINLLTNTDQYHAGCRDINLCHLDSCQKVAYGDGNSRAVADLLVLPVCTECCYKDNCNIDLCGAKSSEIPSNITRCYNCKNMRDESVCENTVDCDLKLGRCLVQKNPDGSFNLGCIHARQCGILVANAEDVSNETRCCQKHLCNGNPKTPKLDTASIYKAFSCPPNLAHPTTTKLSTSQTTTAPAPQTTAPKTNAPSTAPQTTAPTTITTATTPTTTTTTTPTTTSTATTTTTTTTTITPTATTTTATTPTNTATSPDLATNAPSTTSPPQTTSPTTTTTSTVPTTTTTATTPTTTTTATTPTTISTTPFLETVAQSTAPPPKTLSPEVTTSCAVCAGPDFLCEKLFAPTPCPAPDNYCINTVINHKDGTRNVERKCGDFDTCYREWFQGSSDDDKCRQFDENNEQRLDFQCTYCCITDDCNIPLRPDAASLYKPA